MLLAAGKPDESRLLHWFLFDLGWHLSGGAIMGIAVGAALVGANKFLPEGWRLRDTNSGIVSTGLAFIAYGCAEGIHANGFVAVFCEAVAIRNLTGTPDYSRVLTQTVEQLERTAMVVLLVYLGVSIADGLFAHVGWPEIAFALLLQIARPLFVEIAFIGSEHSHKTRAALGFFGIRRIASLYYASFLWNQHGIDPKHKLTAIVGLVVLISVVLYGATTDTVAKRLLGHPPEEEPASGA